MSKRKIVVRDPETDKEKTIPAKSLSVSVDRVCRFLTENGWADVAGLTLNGERLPGSKKLSDVGYVYGDVLEVYKEQIVVWDPLRSKPITVKYKDALVSKLVEYLKKNDVQEFDELRYKGKTMNWNKRLSECGYEPGARIEIYRRRVLVVAIGDETRKLDYQNYKISDLIEDLGGSVELRYKGQIVPTHKTLEDINYIPGDELQAVKKSVRQTLSRKPMRVMAFDPLSGRSIPLSVITQKTDLVQDVFDAVKMTYSDAIDIFYGGLSVDKQKSLGEIGYTDDTSFIVYRQSETPGLEVTPPADPEPDGEAEYFQRLKSQIPDPEYQDLTRIKFPDGFDEAMRILFWDACGRDVREVQQRLLKL